MKKNHTQVVVSPRCACHYSNPEAAHAGEASVAVNLREQEQSLVVTGTPVYCGTIPAGHRLLLVDGNRHFSLHSSTIYCDGTAVTTVTSDVIAMYRVGDGLVVVTRDGLLHLRYSGDTCEVVNKAQAIPSITLVVADELSTQISLDAYTFASPYKSWSEPLHADDIAALTSRYRAAWRNAVAAVSAQGGYYTPLMACYAVRMWDDNYLWVSNPVTIGLTTLANAQPVTAAVTTASSSYTGIAATTMSMAGYRLGIKVQSGVGESWRSMVKAIDVFVTAQPAIADVSSLYYRCLTTQGGTRTPNLQYGWQSLSQSRVVAALEASGWHMVATTTDVDSLAQGRFVASNVTHVAATATGVINAPMTDGATLTREQVTAINSGSSEIAPVAAMVRNGRLYIASASGQLACSAHGNAMITQQVARVTGASLMAIAPVSRPLYSGGFGRYAAYLFTSEGIYAVAQSAMGVLGEARLVDRSIIAAGCVPVDGDRDVYYIDRNGWLCRLTGSQVSRLLPGVTASATMSWDDSHCELHLLGDDGVVAVTPQGHYSRRTLEATALYDDVSHSIAVTAQGQLYDLTREESCVLPVEYRSHPIVIASHRYARPRHVSWCVVSDESQLTLSLRGERGMSCHGFLLGSLRVGGIVAAPLSMPVVSPPCRTMRLEVTGTAHTGTVINSICVS
ncbi:MAG: hypothetical protein KBT09_05645 [Bacteroidales bacterium]|nr:hypothetical protein [Candidatus Sodaliphilus fimicaballi]